MSRNSRFEGLTNRSPLLAQILAQMDRQQQFQPQSYGALAAGLGAQFLDQQTLKGELAKEQQAKDKQGSDLAAALSKYQADMGGGMKLPGTGVQLDTLQDPNARQNLMGSLVQQEHPMAQALAGQLMSQQFAAPPAPEKVDLGNEIAFMQGGQIVGRIPKGVSPDTTHSQAGADRRHLGVSGDAALREKGDDRRFGIREQNENARADMTTGRRNWKDTMSIRKEYQGLPSVQNYEKVLPQLKGIAEAPDTPAGDLVIVNAVAKINDPDSAIRTEEFEHVFNSTAPVEAAIGKVKFAVTGTGRLTAKSRQELQAAAQAKVSGFKQAYDRDYDRFSEYAAGMGTDPSEVVGTKIDSAFTNRGKVKIQSQAEYDKLQSGTEYIDPKGQVRRKK